MPPTPNDFALLQQKVDAIYKSVEKTRTYFLYTLILSVVLVVLPAIGLLFALPSVLGTLGTIQDVGALEGL
jgi:hypothetical protein